MDTVGRGEGEAIVEVRHRGKWWSRRWMENEMLAARTNASSSDETPWTTWQNHSVGGKINRLAGQEDDVFLDHP
jgi:hypothetical protein